MASKTLRRLVITIFCLIALLVFVTPELTWAEKRDEVVIEGEDQKPSRSSFDYSDTEGDTINYSNIGTKDAPRPTAPSRFEEPSLDRDTGTVRHGELQTSNVTAVNEFSNLELLMIGAGLLTVLAVL